MSVALSLSGNATKGDRTLQVYLLGSVDFEAAGYHARVLQHEIDHLDGLVYLDRMRDMKSLAYTVNFG